MPATNATKTMRKMMSVQQTLRFNGLRDFCLELCKDGKNRKTETNV